MPRSKKPKRETARDTDEITARAARLGITVERVLQEYERIAFADVRHVIEVTGEGYRLKPPNELSDAIVPAIHEIVPGDPEHARIKFYDKKAALDALARHLGMFPAAPRHPEGAADSAPAEQAEDPREFLARELARLAGETAEE
jgi:hypothetical protein